MARFRPVRASPPAGRSRREPCPRPTSAGFGRSHAFAAARDQTLAQLALTWILRQPSVTSVLIGASSVAQLEQNVAAVGAPALTLDEIAAIEPHAVHGTSLG